jgi:hypothetical protein
MREESTHTYQGVYEPEYFVDERELQLLEQEQQSGKERKGAWEGLEAGGK